MTTDPGEQPHMSLLLPFVVCQSFGGPYQDEAFVAGYQAGRLDRALGAVRAVGGHTFQATVQTPLVPQAELLGMHHGFPQIVATPCEGLPEWTFVTFSTGHFSEPGAISPAGD